MSTLIVTVGLPRSGKTTWARDQGHPIVNPDSIRYAVHGQRFVKEAEALVWAIAVIMARALFMAGHETVIVDGCHNTIKRRLFWEEELKNDGVTVSFEFFRAHVTECIKRARSIGDDEIVPVIERMNAEADWF